MKWRSLIFLFLLGLLPCGASEQSDLAPAVLPPHLTAPIIHHIAEGASPQFEVDRQKPLWFGFWNIRWFPGHHPVRRSDELTQRQIQAVRQRIASWHPHVLFASEILDAASLAKLDLGYPHIACTDIPRTEDENPSLPQQGIAIMSRIPWRDIWVIDFSRLPLTEDRPSRGILGVAFELPNGQTLTCYAVHLKSNRGGIEYSALRRRRAIDYLQWDFQRRGISPRRDQIVVVGDFNTSPTDPGFEVDQTLTRLESLGFHHSGGDLSRERRLTLQSGAYPANDFDHIFVSAPIWKILNNHSSIRQEVRLVEPTESDHHAVFLNLVRLFQ